MVHLFSIAGIPREVCRLRQGADDVQTPLKSGCENVRRRMPGRKVEAYPKAFLLASRRWTGSIDDGSAR